MISQVTGPAFLLAAEAQLLAVLVSRLERIVDRSRMIAQTDGDSAEYAHLQAELPILRKRGLLMHYAMYWGRGELHRDERSRHRQLRGGLPSCAP